ncbi:MAG TPA: glycosyltransferase, partial [Kofleriaceae bacterium]|nr:glycosyltransferase [Kofleriaceae bacterium]
MTVRDGARFLAQALDSALAQTFADWELILWNDGSTDETAAIAESFAAKDARIRVFASSPLGRRRALVEAHREARGTYIGWLDADDWLAPDALARTHAAIAKSGADMVYTDHVVVTADGLHERNRRSHIPYSAHRLLLDFITFHFRLFSRDIFERAGGIAPDRDIAIDYDLCLRISELGRIERIDEPLYFYRVHAAQMSTRFRPAQVAASAAAIRAALVRRGMTSYELVVDEQRGRFRLEHRPPPIGALRLAFATAFPRWRATRTEPVGTPSVIGHWPAVGRGVVYPGPDPSVDRGAQLRPLGTNLASLMRSVWTGRAGDMLRIYGIAPLLEAGDDGSVLGACWLFIKTLDHALARQMRIVWIANAPLATHHRHAKRERWCRRALAERCHGVVTSCAADVDMFWELGVGRERIVVAPAISVGPRPVARLVEKRPVAGTLPISIVIPLRNRAGQDVRNALASLAWQQGGAPFEVIIVSHGSNPETDAELREIAIEQNATLIAVGSPSDPWSKSLALNTGIRATDP